LRGKPNQYTDYINLLDGPIEDFPDNVYSGNITAEQLRIYFESPSADINELKARLRDWHEKKLKLVVVTSVVLHVYRRSESESDIEDDGHDGYVRYYPKEDQQPLSATLEMSTKDLLNDLNDNNRKLVALSVDL
jgi:hypothetical protein